MQLRFDAPTLAAMATTLLLWSSAFPALRMALRVYSPGHLSLLRFLIASGVLAAYALLTRMRLPERRDLPAILLAGFLGVTAYHVALNYGQATVTAGSGSFLVNAAPVFTALLARLFLGERLRAWGWAGIGLSFAGVAAIALGEGGGFRLSQGALLILLAAAFVSVYVVFQKPYLEKYRALEFAAWTIWAGTLFMLPLFARGLVGAVRDAPPSATLALVYLGVFPGAIAYVTWTYVLSRLPASRASSILYLVPVLVVIFSWLLLGEVPTPLALAGGMVALAGVAVTNTWGRMAEKETG